LAQLIHHRLGQARICTRDTCLSASKTFVDAFDQQLAEVASDIRMRADHLLGIHANLLIGRMGINAS
jgi:hypothetical protein